MGFRVDLETAVSLLGVGLWGMLVNCAILTLLSLRTPRGFEGLPI